MNPAEPPPASRAAWALPLLVAVLTFAFHLGFGLWFWTASPTRAAKTNLQLTGTAYLESFPTWDTEHEADAAFYNRGAVEAMRTGLPRTRSGMFFEHAPLYAWFLGGCYQLFGVRLLAMAVPQAVLAGLTALFVGLTAARLCPRAAPAAGLAASSLMLVNLHLAAYTATASPTLLLLFLFALAVWQLIRSGADRPRLGFFLPLVLAVFVQAAFFIVAFAVVGWGVWTAWRERRWRWAVASALLAAGALLKPGIGMFIDRSMETHSTEAPTTILWEANNPYYESMTVGSLWERRPGNHWSDWRMSAAESAAYAEYLRRGGGNGTRAALLWIREHPGDYLELCVVRLRGMLGPFTGQMSPLYRKISTGLWLLVFPAGFWGFWKLRQTAFGRLALCILVVEAAFETLVVAGWQPRYRLPIDLLLYSAAGTVYAGLLMPIWRRVWPPSAA
jgi:4-amino-4-deoxy-L-arabinose transferase-like glycosyltransferase